MKQTKYTVTVGQILLDLETLTEGIFEAETERTEDSLYLTFTNGQRFRLCVQDARALSKYGSTNPST